MRVVGATFHRREAAERVLRELRRRFDLSHGDAAVAPLGEDGESDAAVLAGRFREERVRTVRALVERHGGRVAVEVDEQATHRWPQPAGGAGSSLGRAR